MARSSNLPNDFNVYEFDISLTLRRRTDRYTSDELARVRIERVIPLANDHDAKREMQALVNEELHRVIGVTEARIDFENRVKALTGGDAIDSTADEA